MATSVESETDTSRQRLGSPRPGDSSRFHADSHHPRVPEPPSAHLERRSGLRQTQLIRPIRCVPRYLWCNGSSGQHQGEALQDQSDADHLGSGGTERCLAQALTQCGLDTSSACIRLDGALELFGERCRMTASFRLFKSTINSYGNVCVYCHPNRVPACQACSPARSPIGCNDHCFPWWMK